MKFFNLKHFLVKHLCMATFVLIVPISVAAQLADSLSDAALENIVISANRTAELKMDIPHQIQIIGKKQIARLSPQTTADLLQNSGEVFVQKSQQGGGSPVLRGFEANKVLLVVDGVRMNNAIFRGGHLQNIITMDPAALDRVEVMYGAGSVIYGTDAIGGVISLFTVRPRLNERKSGGFMRFSNANRGATAHVNVNVGAKTWASYTALTVNQFGDLRSGAQGPMRRDYPGFGDRRFIVERIDGRDSVLTNADVNLQAGSGYQQLDLLQKVLFTPNDRFTHTFNLQFSTSSNVPRYDRLTEESNGLPRFAEWYYGPQTRGLASYEFAWQANQKWADLVRIIPSYQRVQESRNDRRFNNAKRNERVEYLNIGALNLDIFKNIGEHELRYGAEWVINALQSEGRRWDLDTRTASPLQSRYPDGTYTTAGVYATHRWEILGKKLILTDGLRYSRFRMDVEFDPTFVELTDIRIVQQSAGSLNYNIGMVSNLNNGFRVSAMVSSGFRNPNIDDAGRFFEASGDGLVLPNPNLKPEQIQHRELSLGYQNRGFEWAGTVFHSSLSDAITVRPTTYNGQNTITFAGLDYQPLTTVNVAQAQVWGVSANSQLRISTWFVRGSIAYTQGRDLSLRLPLDHIPPLMAQLRTAWEQKKWRLETDILYNGWKRIADYSPSGEDNPQYATPDGMPSWWAWNVRGSYQVNQRWRVQGAVENLLDRRYRVFASGINGAGRNLVIGVYYQ
jgi:hemoglobin/transferrin/lactoferrin receptor protein